MQLRILVPLSQQLIHHIDRKDQYCQAGREHAINHLRQIDTYKALQEMTSFQYVHGVITKIDHMPGH